MTQKRKSRKIFTETELYNFCLGEICGMSVEEESGYSSDWADFANEELEEKYDKLSEAGQKAFDKELRRVARKFRENFDNLPEKIESEEDYKYLQEEKEYLVDKVSVELNEFLEE